MVSNPNFYGQSTHGTPNQIEDGVESLVDNCYNKDDMKSENLKKNYCEFAKDVKALKNSNLYEKICN